MNEADIKPEEMKEAQRLHMYNTLARWWPSTLTYARRGAWAEFRCWFVGHVWDTHWSTGIDDGREIAKGWRHCLSCNKREMAEIDLTPRRRNLLGV